MRARASRGSAIPATTTTRVFSWWHGSAAVEAGSSPCQILHVAVAMPGCLTLKVARWCCFLVEILCFASRQRAVLQPAGGRLPLEARGNSWCDFSFCTHSGSGTPGGERSSLFRLFPHFLLTFSSDPPFFSSTAVLLFSRGVLSPLGYVFAIGFCVAGDYTAPR